MDNIKHLIITRFKTFSLLTVSMVLSIVLLMIKIKLAHSFFLLFLVWNLFLAIIPFAITTYLISLPKLNKFSMLIWFGVWLLFLPNAPYIITDLMHLRLNEDPYLWLDILVVASFAFNGLLLFYFSVLDMKKMLQSYLKKPIVNYGLILICFLSGFGIYLGRFLRYNSWEILSKPKYLLLDIIKIIIKPLIHKEAWLFTILFGVFLNIGFWMFKQFYSSSFLK